MIVKYVLCQGTVLPVSKLAYSQICRKSYTKVLAFPIVKYDADSDVISKFFAKTGQENHKLFKPCQTKSLRLVQSI